MKKRIVFVSLSVFLLFSLLIAQYFKIQILEEEKWTKQALSQHEFIIKEPFKRGAFYSNNSLREGHPESPQPLVMDVTCFHFYIDPLAIPERFRDTIAAKLQELAPVGAICRQEMNIRSRARRLCLWLSRETKDAILSWWLPFAKKNKIARNALYFVSDYRRSYPFGKLLGQVLHTIRELKDESTAEAQPTGGLEAYFNDYLKGCQGRRKQLRSPLHHLELDHVIQHPQDGADIYLTVNHCIQAIVEEELEIGVQAAHAKGGWAVMMDPYNGEILALAQYPFFDPARYRDYFNDPEKMEAAKVKALTDAFELGSIMKPITVAIGLKANQLCRAQGKPPLFSPEGPTDTTRTSFPGRGSRPLKDLPRQHRALNMNMAIQKSSNVYMAQIVDRVIQNFGNDWYRSQLVDVFGFGQKTGIELPAEAAGLVPRPGRCYPNGALEWSLPTPYSLSIGYNILATSLQMLRAYGVFANGGYLAKPTLVKKIVSQEGLLYDGEKERTLFPRVLDKEIVDAVVRAMKFTTKVGGTGVLADIYGFTEAGKTGTAEKNIGGIYAKQIHVSSFVGFAPASTERRARFVLIVSVDEPKAMILENGAKNQGGGRCAAPIFREISRRTLEYLGIAPDDPFGYPAKDPRFDGEKADWVKEVKELKILYDKWNA